jgi:hypothetical protein
MRRIRGQSVYDILARRAAAAGIKSLDSTSGRE